MNFSTVLSCFRRLPNDPLLRELKQLLPVLDLPSRPGRQAKLVLIQSVADPYNLLLFSVILREMSKSTQVQPELFVSRSIEAGTGVGFKASIRRSFPYQWLTFRQWVRMYDGIATKVAYRSVSWRHPYTDFLAYFQARKIWKSLRNMTDLEQVCIHGIKCGDLVIDTYLRFRPAATVDLKDRFLCYLIWQAFRDVHRAQRYFSRRRPELYLSSFSTYIQHGIAVRVALSYGTKVVTFGNLQQLGKVLNTDDHFHTKNPVNYRQDFLKRDDQQQLLLRARAQLEARLSGGTDLATAYMAISAYAENSPPFPEIKGAVVVYLHDFFDSPHIYANLLFPDFWSWACFTIETLQAAGIHFYLKRHPNQIGLSAGVVRQLQDKYPSVRFVPEDVTTSRLVIDGMACAVTVYGTIAHEVAYLGVPSIACARHPHVAFDFCWTAHTPAEYAALLQSSNRLVIQDKKAIQRQVLEFYAMHNLALPPDQNVAKGRLVDLWKACLDSQRRNSWGMWAAAEALAQEPGFARFVQEVSSS
jgi:hypothetical protein